MAQLSVAVLILAIAATAYAQQSDNIVQLIQTCQYTSDRLSIQKPLFFSHVAGNNSATSKITVDPTQKFQTIFGFGGAFTDAASTVWASLPQDKRKEIVQLYYGKNGLRYTVGRVPMNSCDFSLYSYNFDNVTDDFGLEHFDMNVTHDTRSMIPFITQAMNLLSNWSSNDLKLFLSPWSPPPWMKIPVDGKQAMDGSAIPNGLETIYYESWANYFIKFISAYQNHGIKFWGLTTQNEPLNDAKWESCCYTSFTQGRFIAEFLGPLINANYPDVLIMAYDHNRENMYTFVEGVFANEKAKNFIAGTAFHWYDYPYYYAINQTRMLDESKFVMGTEACACPGTSTSEAWPRGEMYGHDIIADLNFNAIGWTDWNLILDQNGGPNHVGNLCAACILANVTTGEYEIQPCYYYMGQISKYFERGSVRIASEVAVTLSQTDRALARNQSNVVMWNCMQSAQQQWKVEGKSIVFATKDIQYCLNVQVGDRRYDGLGDGDNVEVLECNNNASSQLWSINSNGTITLDSNGKCLDILFASDENGANVQVSPCDGSASQQFEIHSDGTLRSANGKCVTTGWSPVQAVSALRPDGLVATVILNESDFAVDFTLVYNQSKELATSIPAHSIQTYLYHS